MLETVFSERYMYLVAFVQFPVRKDTVGSVCLELVTWGRKCKISKGLTKTIQKNVLDEG